MNRAEARVVIMTILYQISIYEDNKISYIKDEVIKENLKINNDFVIDIVNGVLENKDKIDELANKYLNNWNIKRLGQTDRAILRMGIYELKYTDTPGIIAINEAVELAKKYSDEKVKNMINGVLDKVYHEDK